MDAAKKKYSKKLYAAVITAAGSALLIEHLYNFGFEPKDILGHEWLGLLLIACGVGLGIWANKK
jgi:hypothetical protein